MGGSESRCCADSDVKKDNTERYGSESQFPNEKVLHLDLDPRSPSSRVDRTPIRVTGTPTGHIKPLMRVQPMVEDGPSRNRATNGKEQIDEVNEAAELDPRSPASSRTPIVLGEKCYDVMQDPRSPSLGIVRTPLVTEETKLNLEDVDTGTCNWAVCETPKKHVYAITESSADYVVEPANDDKCNEMMVDPRSPSEGIERTPLKKTQERDDVFSDAVNCHGDAQPQIVEDLLVPVCDPRSPSEGIKRTPVGKLQQQEPPVILKDCSNISPSSGAEISRTPAIGGVFTGHRELRRMVLLSNASLLTSPSIKKVSHSNSSESMAGNELDFDLPEAATRLDFLDVPRDINKSRSSSTVAILGSDVDCMTLDDSIDEEEESLVPDVDRMTADEKANVVEFSGNFETNKPSQQVVSSSEAHAPLVPAFAENQASCKQLLQPHKYPSYRISSLASEYGSSVDAADSDTNSKFLTAKFSLQSTDDEYLSAQEIPTKPETCAINETASPLLDETANVNFVTTCEVLGKAINGKSECTGKRDKESGDEAQTSGTGASLDNVDIKKNGEDNLVTSDSTMSSTNVDEDDSTNIKNPGQLREIDAGGIFDAKSHSTDKELVEIEDANEMDYPRLEDQKNWMVKDIISMIESRSEDSPTSGMDIQQSTSENSRSDDDPTQCNVTPASEGRKKPKRRLRTPKAVTSKHRHISSSSSTLSTSNSGLKSTKPKSASNSQLYQDRMTYSKADMSPKVLNYSAPATGRSPLAVLNNDSSKTGNGKSVKTPTVVHSTTRLPRYRGASKCASRSHSANSVGRSAKRKTAMNKEN